MRTHEGTTGDDDPPPAEESRQLGAIDATTEPFELELATLLAEYTKVAKTTRRRGRVVFIRLQQRLLSSVEAFYRTLQVHDRAVRRHEAETGAQLSLRVSAATSPSASASDDEYGLDDDEQESLSAAEVEAASSAVEHPEGKARELLDRLLRRAAEVRGAPDAKVLALLDWIRRHQCSGVRVGGSDGLPATARRWSDKRLLVFTEFGDTKRYLYQILSAAVRGTGRDDERILQFHGGMSDEQRDEIQTAFNAPPDEHPVRILLATDAAREGVNLQAHCADLFHYDVPWNPARMEQRNGRIDRTLQPEPVVHCHYFTYPQRREDVVLRKLVEKTRRIVAELGSLSAVVMDGLARVMSEGIDEGTASELDESETRLDDRKSTAEGELEQQRRNLAALRHEIDEAGDILNKSRRVMDFRHGLLESAVDVGLALSGHPPLELLTSADHDGLPQRFALPTLPDSWQRTLNVLRPPRKRDEPLWEWRRRDPLPVSFEPLPRLTSSCSQLHLEHPFVRRILSRFLAQGYSAHDLSRVTVLRNPHDSLVRVIAFGRLSLFGAGAARLHDELVSVAAPWLESGGEGHLKPFADRADRRALELLDDLLADAHGLDDVPERTRKRLLESAADDFARLWPAIRDDADARAHDAEAKLHERGTTEAEELRALLERQRRAIDETMREREQLALEFTDSEAEQRRQFEQDRNYMEGRLGAIEGELESEPLQLEELYRVVLRRLEPVGLVFLWPETRS